MICLFSPLLSIEYLVDKIKLYLEWLWKLFWRWLYVLAEALMIGVALIYLTTVVLDSISGRGPLGWDTESWKFWIWMLIYLLTLLALTVARLREPLSKTFKKFL